MNSASPKVQDPSMEEILASIRRIIADDQDGAAPAASLVRQDDGVGPGEPPPVPFPKREPIREETAFRGLEAPADPPPPPSAPPPPATAQEPLPEPDRLLSSVAQSSAAGALKMLSTTVLNANPRTLEDLVTDLIRPMLKDWLDENLPPLVERLVRSEIDRIARSTR